MNHKIKSIGLLGGSFDPIHLGHTQIAKTVLQSCQLDEIQFIPNHQPATDKILQATPEQRLDMVKLAILHEPHFTVNDIEVLRKGRSYTIDTLKAVRLKHPNQSLNFIMGLDAFLTINLWQGHDEYMSLCNIIIVNRGVNNRIENSPAEDLFHNHYTTSIKSIHEHTHGHIILLNTPSLNISSTHIRQHPHAAKSKENIHPEVQRYIIKNKLYSR